MYFCWKLNSLKKKKLLELIDTDEIEQDMTIIET